MNELNLRELGLYIHIPFCVRKCDYCDFLSAPATDAAKAEYMEALLTEIKSYQGRTSEYIVPTVFIGGGTPSCIPAEDIIRIMEELHRSFHMEEAVLEATIEVNPGTVNKEKLLQYRDAGLNRISFGLQSTEKEELKRLGRIHSFEEFAENYKLAREVGFHNINIDLMSALPGQTPASWEKTLNTVIAMNPEHISAYSLIIEEGTKFYDRYHPGSADQQELPDEDTDRLIYYKTAELLEPAGYHRYEISNYAKMGYECRHNNSYWIGTEYLGLGLGAASLLDGARFSNMRDIKQYNLHCNGYNIALNDRKLVHINRLDGSSISKDPLGIRTEHQVLSKAEQMEEFMFLGLRRCDGISKSTFLERFGITITSAYGPILRALEKKQLINIEGDYIRLTGQGIDLSNMVLAEFLFDE